MILIIFLNLSVCMPFPLISLSLSLSLCLSVTLSLSPYLSVYPFLHLLPSNLPHKSVNSLRAGSGTYTNVTGETLPLSPSVALAHEASGSEGCPTNRSSPTSRPWLMLSLLPEPSSPCHHLHSAHTTVSNPTPSSLELSPAIRPNLLHASPCRSPSISSVPLLQS